MEWVILRIDEKKLCEKFYYCNVYMRQLLIFYIEILNR